MTTEKPLSGSARLASLSEAKAAHRTAMRRMPFLLNLRVAEGLRLSVEALRSARVKPVRAAPNRQKTQSQENPANGRLAEKVACRVP